MKPLVFLTLMASIALPICAHAADTRSWSTIQRGLYLTHAGDCEACHTADPAEPYAGNYSLQTPFGTIYTANLTPDRETGIGTWNADDFYRAMTKGREPDGTRLYPAFPYTHFTIVSREDSDAIFAYLRTLDPINQRAKEPDFPWPLSWRFAVRGWNMINFDAHGFQPESDKSDEWNRGKYLVEGLAHCGMCHSPKSVLGAEKDGDARFTGGAVEGWWAPSLRGNKRDGIGEWSKQELVSFLKYGRNDKSAAIGPMTDVIEHSTRHLRDSDVEAIATYIKSLPSRPENADSDKVDQEKLDEANKIGGEIYAAQCSACHGPDGGGVANMFGELKGSSFAQSKNPRSVIKLILEGGDSAATDKYPTPHAMPAFGWKLTDEEVAAVATYVRNSFGNRAPAVGADTVGDMRTSPKE